MRLFVCAAIVVAACGLAFGQTQYKVLWNFGGAPSDGAFPMSNLIFDKAGNLYGTTYAGGTSTALPCGGGGCGTVFKLSQNPDGSWTNTTLYSFCSNYSNFQCLDGTAPEAGLGIDAKGNLYGTTNGGGNQQCPLQSLGCGTVFEVSPPSSPGDAWIESVLYNFCTTYANHNCTDGALPVSQLTRGASGTIYGTTTVGGSTSGTFGGTVFELSHHPTGWTESVIYSFCSSGHDTVCPDGSQPLAAVTFDKAGNLYGTTSLGGSERQQGGGTVYQLSPSGGGWTENVLYRFLSPFRAGAAPAGNVSLGKRGTLYTTVSSGGKNQQGGVFTFSVGKGIGRTFSFSGQNGNEPKAGVLVDSKNEVIYGTTFAGGSAQAGTVFKIVAPAQESVLYSFCSQQNCEDGGGPSGLVADGSGNLYGTGKGGGANNLGVVFEIIQQAPTASQHAGARSLPKNSH